MTVTTPANEEHGATIVEVAILLPLFFLFLLAVFDFCRYVAQEAALDHAVRLAGQYGAKLTADDCLTPTRDRFLSIIAHTPLVAQVSLRADIVSLPGGMQALQLVAHENGRKFLSLGPAVASGGLFPVEFAGSCTQRLTLIFPTVS